MLPLPLPALRPRRQPGHLGCQRHRQGRHVGPGRSEPRLRLAGQRGGHRRHGLLPAQRSQRPVPGHGGLRATRSRASPRTASRPRPRAGASPARATPAPTATPARRAIRPSRTTSPRPTAPVWRRAQRASPSRLTPAAPSGISASVTGGYYPALSIGVTLDNGSDTGSGIDAASGIVERDEAPLDNGDGSCDAFPGSWSSVTLSGGNDTTVVSGNCYRYRYLLSDRVGNQATSGASATAKVDTSAPTTPTLSFGSLQAAFVTGSTVYYRPRRGQRPVRGHGSFQRRPVRRRLLRLPRRRLRLERLRLGRHSHVQPLRLAHRSGRT